MSKKTEEKFMKAMTTYRPEFRCGYCGARLSRDNDFCNEEHKERYHKIVKAVNKNMAEYQARTGIHGDWGYDTKEGIRWYEQNTNIKIE